MRRWRLLFLLSWMLAWPAAQAALTIEITQGVSGAMPIAIVPFGTKAGVRPPEDIAAIVGADLYRSGRFSPLPAKDLIAQPHQGTDINFKEWRMLGMPNLVVGRITPLGGGLYDIRFQLFDVYKGQQLAGYVYNRIPEKRVRLVAHQISDLIYEKLIGDPGVFTTRLAYVTAEADGKGGRSYTLQVSDVDGHGPRKILVSTQPVMSPAWSPDGSKVAYVSFEQRRAQIYIQEVATGKRTLVATFDGINGAPAWSRDGRRMALTLSKDGNPEIYTLDLATRELKRVTHDPAIDTEPAWAPDGKSLVFTSDRGGGPQLYVYRLETGSTKRLTFEGSYNARGSFSPDGRLVTFVHRQNDNYRIAVLDVERGIMQVLTTASLDESPSFAPNGSMIIYASQDKGNGVLAVVSVDGRVRQRFAWQEGDVREPVWSPAQRF